MKKGMLIYDSSTNCFDVLYLECGKEKQPRRCKYGLRQVSGFDTPAGKCFVAAFSD